MVPGVQVLKLVSDDRLKVRISVPETEIARVARGQKAVIEAPVLNGTKAEGVVTEKGVQANPLSRSYEVNVSISTIPITTLSKILCKWKQDSVVSLFLYLNSVFKHKHKLIHNQAPV